MNAIPLPIELDFKSSVASSTEGPNGNGTYSIRTFDSYQFERSILTPAAPFRFTAPGLSIATRTAIRSGDTATIWVLDSRGNRVQIATGFVDETDTHITPQKVEYLITGRDTMGQLVDNAAIDANNNIINITSITLPAILNQMIDGTRIHAGVKLSQPIPTAPLLFQTNAGETKINALQRMMDFCNCLLWSQPNGQLVLGKPNFAQANYGTLICQPGGTNNNVLEARVRRSPNLAIRQCVSQLQTLEQVSPAGYTVYNQDQDVQRIAPTLAGRSVYSVFSYGQGGDAINQVVAVGNQNGNPNAIGAALSLRQIARENMKVLDVECVVRDHLNSNGTPFNIDQMYNVQIPDENLNEDMYVYSVSYEMTLDHGMLTRLKLCRKGSIVAGAAIIGGS